MTPPDHPAGQSVPEPAAGVTRAAETTSEAERLSGEARGPVTGVGEPAETFRLQFWRPYLITIGAIQLVNVVGLLGLILLLPGPVRISVDALMYCGGYSAALSVIYAVSLFVRTRVNWVRIGPDGLRGSIWWGWPVTVSWASIRRVDRDGMPWSPRAWVFSRECDHIISVPLFLADYSRFAELVTEYAGPDHLFTRVVRERLGDD